tara:strand:- start:47 stop:319 length:273 start_codon:yes stop_codon:yes gene_type:complete
MITVKFTKNAPSGFDGNGKEEYQITEKQLSNFKKYGNYKIEILNTSSEANKVVSSSPDSTWTNAKIMDYLDGEGVSYDSKDNKATLLSKV